ncbi:uncharacterized protein LOC113466675 [Diaphorina citri]|uniref:Uncharacterized protein LOC113466675 n=1 Tax=Diaphorina citri TaxID=121845 RepID=A0A3Q0IPB5_DIACI|nr:uncharacterized protein LOC113466675 [Diaphorina citri]
MPPLQLEQSGQAHAAGGCDIQFLRSSSKDADWVWEKCGTELDNDAARNALRNRLGLVPGLAISSQEDVGRWGSPRQPGALVRERLSFSARLDFFFCMNRLNVTPLIENVNRLEVEGDEARTVEEAIKVLSVSGREPVDMHPEKRMKAAWTAFEAENLQRLKIENPTLRLSQVKQLLRKEWMKSPSNPSNQI